MGYTVILNRLIDDERVSDAEYRLCCKMLKKCYGSKNFCFPSQKLLAREMKRSVRSIQRYIANLVKLGYLKVEKKLGHVNIYIFDKLKEELEEIANKTVNKTKETYKKATSHFKHSNKSKGKTLGFNNFKAREYDYDALERQLLGWDKEDDEENKKAIRPVHE